jgi:hypothetical protein
MMNELRRQKDVNEKLERLISKNVEKERAMMENLAMSEKKNKRQYTFKKRVRKVQKTVAAITRERLDAIKSKVEEGCRKLQDCKKKCVDPTSKKVCLDVYKKTSLYLLQDEKGRRKYVASKLQHGGKNMTTGFPLLKSVCKKCFLAYHGISKSSFHRRKAAMRDGQQAFDRRGSGRQQTSERHAAKAWLEHYGRTRGDMMPDVRDEIHLPEHDWMVVYEKMKKQLLEEGIAGHEKVLSYSKFRSKPFIDGLSFAMKIRKFKRFSKCQICSEFDENISKARKDQKKSLKMCKAKHIEWQYRERDVYYKHRAKGKDFETSSRYLCISIDGMDHSKADLPSKARDDKDTGAR